MRGAGSREQTTAKFIQICASQNDLFALDESGSIYRYNFSTKAWATLDTDADGSAPTRRTTLKVERS
jgi:hypothetical protein